MGLDSSKERDHWDQLADQLFESDAPPERTGGPTTDDEPVAASDAEAAAPDLEQGPSQPSSAPEVPLDETFEPESALPAPLEDGAEDEAFEVSDEPETVPAGAAKEETEQKPQSRSRRRRRGRAKVPAKAESPPAEFATADEEGPEDVSEFEDFDAEESEGDESGTSSGSRANRYGDIPTWDETISYLTRTWAQRGGTGQQEDKRRRGGRGRRTKKAD
jgi:hypothetical protein